MGHSLSAAEWKPEATVGTHSQSALALIGAVPGPRLFDADLVPRATCHPRASANWRPN